MKKKFTKGKIYLSIILLLFFLMGVGYALIESNLSVTNNIEVAAFNTKNLYNYMMVNSSLDNVKSTYVNSDSGISFSAVGSDTNGKGIYKRSTTVKDRYPVYYYRGDITDNNLIFANFCWKIFRTTATGGIKIIYNGVVAADGSCNNSGDATEIGKSAFSSTNTQSIADIGYMYGTRIESEEISSMTSKKYRYGNDVVYSNGTYTLQDVYSSTSTYGLTYLTLQTKYHYSCFSSETSCNPVYYIHRFQPAKTRRVTLSDGMLLSNFLEEHTTKSANTTSSLIKTYIDDWYVNNLKSYESYLEDTVFCNDRSIYEYAGWDKDTTGSSDMHFSGYVRNFITYNPTVSCSSVSDSFTTSANNGNGNLTNPVALITADEIIMGSGGASSYFYTENTYWTMTPSYFSDTGDGAHNYTNGLVLEALTDLTTEAGVRPVVSLKPGTEYTSGNGSPETPYVIN